MGGGARPTWWAAVGFASRAHRHQLRKDGATPYSAHVMRVAMIVMEQFGCTDPVAISAAILHDTIEDTPTDYDDIADAFGDEIASCVAALSKDMRLPEPEREREYDDGLAAADWRARLVKLADVYDNLMDAGTVSLATRVDNCRRAIELGRPDAEAHPETARAIGIVLRASDAAGQTAC